MGEIPWWEWWEIRVRDEVLRFICSESVDIYKPGRGNRVSGCLLSNTYTEGEKGAYGSRFGESVKRDRQAGKTSAIGHGLGMNHDALPTASITYAIKTLHTSEYLCKF